MRWTIKIKLFGLTVISLVFVASVSVAGYWGISSVKQTTADVAANGSAIRNHIHTAGQVGEMITHIATAATQQSSASEEINHNLEQIARLVKDSAAGAQHAAKACQDLSGPAFNLQKIVGHFKLAQSEENVSIRDDGHGRNPYPAPGARGNVQKASHKAFAAAG